MFDKRIIPYLLIFSFLTGTLLFNTGTATAAESNLYWGSKGDAVVQLQQTLNNKGYWCGTNDGIFGAKTYNAVIKFQKDAGITPTGTVGPLTRQALGLSNKSSTGSEQVSRGTRILTMKATAYCPCAKCNYPYGGQPSYLGYPLSRGIIAVDPDVIPLGTRLYVEGYGSGIAADTGNAIQGSHIDLCFSSHQAALDWGVKTVSVTVY
ncbi:MAG: 3D domain-containing protein [Syntrophomonas sp.]